VAQDELGRTGHSRSRRVQHPISPRAPAPLTQAQALIAARSSRALEIGRDGADAEVVPIFACDLAQGLWIDVQGGVDSGEDGVDRPRREHQGLVLHRQRLAGERIEPKAPDQPASCRSRAG